MAAIQLTDRIYSVGVLNPNLRVFDIVMQTEYGTSYNAYLIKGKEKTALVETVHAKYFKPYFANIEEVCPVSEIDYLIMNHNEPDHSGSIAKLLDVNPDITVVVSQAGSIYLKNITNCKDMKVKVVKDGDMLDLGDMPLRFINAPFLHWPDSMFTWAENQKAIFTCDFLGCHYCEPLMIDTEVFYDTAYQISLKGYYDAIFGPFQPYVQKGLEKIKDLPIDFACTSHGPVLTKNGKLGDVLRQYEKWSTPVKKENKQIPIFYTSAYGNTEKIAQAAKEGILEVIPNAQVDCYNIIDHDMPNLAAKINASDAFLLGSPTINKDAVPPAWILLSHLDAINNQKKPCAVFGSYGWSGEAVGSLTSRLEQLRLKVFGQGFRVVFIPSEEDLKQAKEFGKAFAESL